MLRPLFFSLLAVLTAPAAPLLPPREPSAPDGTALAAAWRDLPPAEREAAARGEVLRGNVPDSWRTFAEVKITRSIHGRERTAALRVAPDYLAVGSDADALLLPLSPQSAQVLAEALGCTLPTPRIVDAIFSAAQKLPPQPLQPSPRMTTLPVFIEHNRLVQEQRRALGSTGAPGVLLAGHKKDVVLTLKLAAHPGKVAIYGWHRLDGTPIQPLYLGHTASWVDYSHGIRLVDRTLSVDGAKTTIAAVLADAESCELLGDEGPGPLPAYPPPAADTSPETWKKIDLEDGARALLTAPAKLDPAKPAHLVIYAAPAGSTVEQTLGHRRPASHDWRDDIQHIAAQTRWLREVAHEENLIVAVLQCAEKSWVAWKKKHADASARIARLVGELRRHAGHPARLTLAAHSAGGAFVFGYVDAQEEIPEFVERLAFLDANYAYDAAKGHAAKLARWLSADTQHALLVLAYHDSVALLEGKTFVSEAGGTWGRSRAMLGDLGGHFAFTREDDAAMQRATALDRRVQFLLAENPTRAVLHTRLVEWNGFIHALLAGTPREGKGYRYFGPRAYEAWISSRPPGTAAP
jgi:hypothetical protein